MVLGGKAMKIYLCGITHNQKQNISGTTEYSDYFDGLIWVDHYSTDGTYKLLQSRKKAGQIIQVPFTKNHDLSMNFFLHAGPMRNGDWFFLRDSMERFNKEWVTNIKNFVATLRNQGIKSVFSHNKGFGFEFNDSMFFQGSPHWGLQGWQNKAIDLKNYYKEEKEYAYRIKDGEEGGRPLWNWIDHFARYYWVYGRSNHLLLGNENNLDKYKELEENRLTFRMYCQIAYKADFTIESLKILLKSDNWKQDKEFLRMFNKEKILKSFYRFHILEHDWQDIMKTENTWVYE